MPAGCGEPNYDFKISDNGGSSYRGLVSFKWWDNDDGTSKITIESTDVDDAGSYPVELTLDIGGVEEVFIFTVVT